MQHNRLTIFALLLLVLGSCTNSELLRPGQGNQTLGNTLTLQGEYCSLKPETEPHHTRVMLLVDTSNGIARSDASCRRVSTAKPLLDALMPTIDNNDAYFDVIGYNDVVERQTPSNPTFTNERGEIEQAIYGHLTNGTLLNSSACNTSTLPTGAESLGLYKQFGGTNLLALLSVALGDIEKDAGELDLDTRSKTSYIIILVSGKIRNKYLEYKSGSVTNDFRPTILNTAKDIATLQETLKIGRIKLNTAFLFDPTETDPAGTPDADKADTAQARDILTKIAATGNGVYKEFPLSGPDARIFSYQSFDFSAPSLVYRPKRLLAYNMNAFFAEDSDGDGLSDVEEDALGLRKDRVSSEPDGQEDECSDAFEMGLSYGKIWFLDFSRRYQADYVAKQKSFDAYASDYRNFLNTALPQFKRDPKTKDCTCDSIFKLALKNNLVDLSDESRLMYECKGSKSDNQLLVVADSDADGLSDYTEIGLGTDPFNPDSDFDGLRDSLEVRFGKNPLQADSLCTEAQTIDSDNDGLTDCEEWYLKTKSDAFDSDEDGVSDLIEAYSGTNPKEADLDQDPDMDGVLNFTEIQRHSNPLATNPSSHNSFFYQTTLEEKKIEDQNRVCMTFTIANITLAHTYAWPALNPPDAPGMTEKRYNSFIKKIEGMNAIYVQITESPEREMRSLGVLTAAKVEVPFKWGEIDPDVSPDAQDGKGIRILDSAKFKFIDDFNY